MNSLGAKISVVLLFVLVAGFFVLRNNGLGEVAYPKAVMTLEKESYSATEAIMLTINLNESQEQTRNWFISKAFAQSSGPFKASVIGPDKKAVEVPVTVEEKGEGVYNVSITPTSQMDPGRQTLQVELRDGLATRTIEQDFMWGVLAINTHKSIYTLGEEANLAMAVLDDRGRMVCNADVRLEIKSPSSQITTFSSEDGSIIVNPDCEVYSVTINPDYEAVYQVEGVGEYQMELTAITDNGKYSISDTFEVRESVPFDVERIAHTRIYPTEDYKVEMRVKANQDFSGIIEEVIPTEFSLVDKNAEYTVETGEEKIVKWEIELTEGEEITLSYTYDAPDISPEFYTLGPLVFRDENEIVFQEARTWQIASDAIAFRASTTATDGGSNETIVINKPAGTVQNDVMIATFVGEDDVIYESSGWTQIRTQLDGDGSPDHRSTIFYKVAGASEPSSYTFENTDNANEALMGAIVTYTGVNTTSPVDVHGGTNDGDNANSTLVAPSVTTTVANTMLLSVFGSVSTGAMTHPSGMSERFDFSFGVHSMSLADETRSGTGATGTRTATSGGSGFWTAQSVALNPAAGGGPTPTPTPTNTPTPTPTPPAPTATPTPTTAPPGSFRFERVELEGVQLD